MNTDKKRVCKRIGARLVLLLAVCLWLAAPVAAESPTVPGTKSGFVTTPDGVKIHYLTAGKMKGEVTSRTESPDRDVTLTPNILFVPGWTMPGWIWEHQITHFSKTHRVVAMDPRSQGESDKPAEGHHPAARAHDIKAVVDELKLAPVVLIGWSMGVTEIASFVDQFGTGNLAGIVLVDGYAGSDFDLQNSPQFLKWAASFLIDRPKATGAFVRSMYRQPQSEDYLRRVIDASLKTPTNSAAALLLASRATDNRPALAKFDKPTLVIVARSPWLKYYEEVHQLTPGSHFVVLEDAGHALFVDKAGEFNSALEGFLESVKITMIMR